MTRKEALAELIAKVDAGTLHPDDLIVSPEFSQMIDMAVNVSDFEAIAASRFKALHAQEQEKDQ